MLKFAIAIALFALIGGGVAAVQDYIDVFRSRSRRSDVALERIEQDTMPKFKHRFMVGAGAGSLLGLIVVTVSTLKKKEL